MVLRDGSVRTGRSQRFPGGQPDREPLSTRPAAVLLGVLTVWTLVPAQALPTKVRWALTVAVIAVVFNAVLAHTDRMRWTAPVTLVGVLSLCSTLSVLHHGDAPDMFDGLLTGVLLVGVLLLATTCSRSDVRFLIRGLIGLALVELAVALLSTFAGVAEPWGYLGTGETSLGANPLLPALGARSLGTLAHPLPFGLLMGAGAVLALFTPWTRHWQPRLAVASALTAGILLSGSRSAVIAAVIAVVVGLLLPAGRSRKAATLRLGAAVATAAVLFTVDVGNLAVFSSLEGTGSLEHRLGALDAAGRLMGRPLLELFFGSGGGSLVALYADRYLQTDGFLAVDNQLVQTFAVAGLVGVVCLLALVVLGLVRGDRGSRPAAVFMLVMFFSFDVLTWESAAVLFTILVALASAGPPVPAHLLGAAREPAGASAEDGPSTA
jgi:hypothetical protein